jgi:ketosteroid isomerase-like protein
VAAEISSAEIRAAVQKFWDILCGRSKERLEDLYSGSAIVFTGKAKRSERGALTALRRMRQSGSVDSAPIAELDPIEVQIAGDVAIATYTYRFHSSKTGKDGSREHRDTLYGRSTQIFQRDERGTLRIVHEHLSSAAPPAVEKAKG